MEDRNTVSHLPSSILHPLSSISSCLSGSSYTTNVQILCRLERILLRGFFALFASSRLIPDSAFTAKTRTRKENAKQLVWLAARLSLCSSVVSLIVLDLDGLHGVNPCPIRVPFPHGAVVALCASMIPTFTGMSEATGS